MTPPWLVERRPCLFESLPKSGQSGDAPFRSIQQAINSLPDNDTQAIIQIGPGVYNEKIYLSRNNVALIGAGADNTEIRVAELRPHDGFTILKKDIADQDVRIWIRSQLAGFKVPRAVVFGELPKTSTGKIQKFELRKQAGSAAAIDV